MSAVWPESEREARRKDTLRAADVLAALPHLAWIAEQIREAARNPGINLVSRLALTKAPGRPRKREGQAPVHLVASQAVHPAASQPLHLVAQQPAHLVAIQPAPVKVSHLGVSIFRLGQSAQILKRPSVDLGRAMSARVYRIGSTQSHRMRRE